MARPEIVARLMDGLRQGDQRAGRELVDLFYPELRRLAAAHMKDERLAHTWQPTALVHELYLELIRMKGLNPRDHGDNERAAFFGLAGQMMRRLLIHHARPLYRRVERVEIAAPRALSLRRAMRFRKSKMCWRGWRQSIPGSGPSSK